MIRIDRASAFSSSLAYYHECCTSRQPHLTHLDEDVPVSVLVKQLRVHELELGDISASVLVLLLELVVGVLSLGVFVQVLHVRVRRGRVEVVVDLFDVFTVVPCISAMCGDDRNTTLLRTLATVQTVQSLLQNRVLAVPKAKSETQALVVVTVIQQSVRGES